MNDGNAVAILFNHISYKAGSIFFLHVYTMVELFHL